MNHNSWIDIEGLYTHPHVNKKTISLFQVLRLTQSSYTKKEGNTAHYCSFFLPVDYARKKIYLCHHKKADDWIPPGGHIESNETPKQAAVREMFEELRVKLDSSHFKPWNLSVKPINRPESGCLSHYDIWYLVDTHAQEYDFDTKEYHAAAWFEQNTAVSMIKKNPDFAHIISQLPLS